MGRFRFSFSVAFSLLGAASLVACGGGGDSTSGTTGAVPVAAPAVQDPASDLRVAAESKCYEDVAPAVGNVTVTDVDSQGGVVGTLHTEVKVVSLNSTFNGTSGLIETSVASKLTGISSGVPIDFDISGSGYFRQMSPRVSAVYGASTTQMRSLTSSFTTFTTAIVYAPPYVDGSGDLAVGQTGTYSYTGTVNTSLPSSGPTSGSKTVRFVGREMVTVPAGTFNACRYEVVDSGPEGTRVTTHWAYRGIEVKSVSGSDVIRLKSATINRISI